MHPVIRKLSLFDSVDPDDARALQNAFFPRRLAARGPHHRG